MISLLGLGPPPLPAAAHRHHLPPATVTYISQQYADHGRRRRSGGNGNDGVVVEYVGLDEFLEEGEEEDSKVDLMQRPAGQQRLQEDGAEEDMEDAGELKT